MVIAWQTTERLKRIFDSRAGLYQQARPEYPDQLYDVLVETAGIKPSNRLLEVGCTTERRPFRSLVAAFR